SGVAMTLVDWDDMPRWRLINRALGLYFYEPAETYFTSPHFFFDLCIPKCTKCRIPHKHSHGEVAGQRKWRRTERQRGLGSARSGERRGGSSDRRGASAGSGDEERKPRRRRQRRRTRGGKPVNRPQGGRPTADSNES